MDQLDSQSQATSEYPGSPILRVIFFSDLVGSTDMKRRLGDAGAARLMSRHDSLFRYLLSQYRGREEAQTGDGFFATFDLPSDAARFALAFQDALRRWDEGEAPAARVGLHLGEILTLDGSDKKLVGLAVDLTSRVMGLAEGGQILMTRAVFDSVRQQLREGFGDRPLRWLSHGPYSLKGIDEAVEVCEVGAEGLAPLRMPNESEKARGEWTSDGFSQPIGRLRRNPICLCF